MHTGRWAWPIGRLSQSKDRHHAALRRLIGLGYNANNQITSVTLNGSTTILSGVTYDPFGPITGWTWGNSTTASRAFDTDGKLTQLDNANGTSLKNLAYDDAFRITGITDVGNSAYSWSYGYDNLDRLTSATGSSITRGWSYDANGNRLTETGSAPSSFTYTTSPGSNRLASITGSLPRTYGYDAAGNTLSYASATFSYNARGRMASATNSGSTAAYVYNALGQRVKRTVSGAATLYAYDEAGHLQGEYNSTGALVQETVWLGDIPIATIRPNGSSGVDLFYLHADQLNTPRLVTDTTNNLRWIWESDPFGTNAPDENPSSLGLFKYNLRFPGQQFDGVLGLHYNYFREYDPAIGGYIESDPIGLKGGINTYAYVRGNPLSKSDPRGLAPPRSQPGIGFPPLFPPGPFDDDWNRARDNAAKAIGDALNRLLNGIRNLCRSEPQTCREHYNACLESGWGGKVGYESACFACFQRCQGSGNNEWPDSVTSGNWGTITVYCDYWSKK